MRLETRGSQHITQQIIRPVTTNEVRKQKYDKRKSKTWTAAPENWEIWPHLIYLIYYSWFTGRDSNQIPP